MFFLNASLKENRRQKVRKSPNLDIFLANL